MVESVGATKGDGAIDAWIVRATERTVKQLREEIACVAMHARVDGRRPEGCAPPDAEMMADAVTLEREVIAVVSGQEREMGDPCPDVREEEAPEVTTTMLRLSVSEETAGFWRADGRRRRRARAHVAGFGLDVGRTAAMKASASSVLRTSVGPSPVRRASVTAF